VLRALSILKEKILSQSKSAVNAEPAQTGVLKHHLFSLRMKFISVFTLLILLVMGVVTTLILYQVQQTLVEQIINRAEAQASSLATNSVDEMLKQLSQSATVTGTAAGEDVDLTLMQSASDAMKEGSGSAVRDIPTGLKPLGGAGASNQQCSLRHDSKISLAR
jgi:hypothetical protein